MNKHIIVINGRGGVGKDTLIEAMYNNADVIVYNISAITPIKIAAEKFFGWKGSKTAKDRKFLADLRALAEEYNDTSMNYLKDMTEQCWNQDPNSTKVIIFVCIREPKNIERYVTWVREQLKENVVHTLLIKGNCDPEASGNSSDDNVENYPYDYIYENVLSLTEAKQNFVQWIKRQLHL